MGPKEDHKIPNGTLAYRRFLMGPRNDQKIANGTSGFTLDS